jgi:hypothetical protein
MCSRLPVPPACHLYLPSDHQRIHQSPLHPPLHLVDAILLLFFVIAGKKSFLRLRLLLPLLIILPCWKHYLLVRSCHDLHANQHRIRHQTQSYNQHFFSTACLSSVGCQTVLLLLLATPARCHLTKVVAHIRIDAMRAHSHLVMLVAWLVTSAGLIRNQ